VRLARVLPPKKHPQGRFFVIYPTHRIDLLPGVAGHPADAIGALQRQKLRCSFTVYLYTPQSAAHFFLVLHPIV